MVTKFYFKVGEKKKIWENREKRQKLKKISLFEKKTNSQHFLKICYEICFADDENRQLISFLCFTNEVHNQFDFNT